MLSVSAEDNVDWPYLMVLSSKVEPDESRKQLTSYGSDVKCIMSILSNWPHNSDIASRDNVARFNTRKLTRYLNALTFKN